MTQQVSSSDWEDKVLKAPGRVLVDFFAVWCGPCRMLAPTLEEIEAEMGDSLTVFKLDTDQAPDIAARYGIRGVPTVMLFENGKPIGQLVGVQPKQTILDMIRA